MFLRNYSFLGKLLLRNRRQDKCSRYLQEEHRIQNVPEYEDGHLDVHPGCLSVPSEHRRVHIDSQDGSEDGGGVGRLGASKSTQCVR